MLYVATWKKIFFINIKYKFDNCFSSSNIVQLINQNLRLFKLHKVKTWGERANNTVYKMSS